MACTQLVSDGKAVGWACGPGPRRVFCHRCRKESERQCDFPVGTTKKGKTRDCNKHLCLDHARSSSKTGKDLCPAHHYQVVLATILRQLVDGPRLLRPVSPHYHLHHALVQQRFVRAFPQRGGIHLTITHEGLAWVRTQPDLTPPSPADAPIASPDPTPLTP